MPAPVQCLRPSTIRHRLLHGAGFNWFDHLGSGGCYAGASRAYPLDIQVHPDPADEPAWRALTAELDRMRPGFIRFGLPPDAHCDGDGRFRPGGPHLARLARLDAWATANGCTIMLDTFLLPQRHALVCGTAEETSHPDSMRQHLALDNRVLVQRFLVPLLVHVVNDLGLRSVGWFNVINEPFCYGVGTLPDGAGDAVVHYADMYRQLRTGLNAARIPRTRLRLAGCDLIYFFMRDTMRRLLTEQRLGDVLDGVTVHYYHLFPERDALALGDPSKGPYWARMDLQIDDHSAELATWCRFQGIPLLASEIGTFCYGYRDHPSGAASFAAQLTVAEAVVRLANLGIGTFGFWSLLNPDTIDGHWSTLRFGDDGIEHIAHVSPVRSLLCQALRPGAEIAPLAGAAEVHALLVGGTEPSLLAVNRSDRSVSLAVTPPDDWPAWDPVSGIAITSAGASRLPAARRRNGAWRIRLPARSVCRLASQATWSPATTSASGPRVQSLVH